METQETLGNVTSEIRTVEALFLPRLELLRKLKDLDSPLDFTHPRGITLTPGLPGANITVWHRFARAVPDTPARESTVKGNALQYLNTSGRNPVFTVNQDFGFQLENPDGLHTKM